MVRCINTINSVDYFTKVSSWRCCFTLHHHPSIHWEALLMSDAVPVHLPLCSSCQVIPTERVQHIKGWANVHSQARSLTLRILSSKWSDVSTNQECQATRQSCWSQCCLYLQEVRTHHFYHSRIQGRRLWCRWCLEWSIGLFPFHLQRHSSDECLKLDFH